MNNNFFVRKSRPCFIKYKASKKNEVGNTLVIHLKTVYKVKSKLRRNTRIYLNYGLTEKFIQDKQ